jgi:multicomponent Na+:H+ antiporter subunit E
LPAYGPKLARLVELLGYFIWELFVANLRVAYDVLTPWHRMRPGVIAVPLTISTNAEITMLANLLTLTPGTLSLDISQDRRTLYVHAMYLGDVEAERRKIQHGFERRILAVMR